MIFGVVFACCVDPWVPDDGTLSGARSSSTPCAKVQPRKVQLPFCSQFRQIVVLNLDGSVPRLFPPLALASTIAESGGNVAALVGPNGGDLWAINPGDT